LDGDSYCPVQRKKPTRHRIGFSFFLLTSTFYILGHAVAGSSLGARHSRQLQPLKNRLNCHSSQTRRLISTSQVRSDISRTFHVANLSLSPACPACAYPPCSSFWRAPLWSTRTLFSGRLVQPLTDVFKEQGHARCYRNDKGENYSLDSDLL